MQGITLAIKTQKVVAAAAVLAPHIPQLLSHVPPNASAPASPELVPLHVPSAAPVSPALLRMRPQPRPPQLTTASPLPYGFRWRVRAGLSAAHAQHVPAPLSTAHAESAVAVATGTRTRRSWGRHVGHPVRVAQPGGDAVPARG